MACPFCGAGPIAAGPVRPFGDDLRRGIAAVYGAPSVPRRLGPGVWVGALASLGAAATMHWWLLR